MKHCFVTHKKMVLNEQKQYLLAFIYFLEVENSLLFFAPPSFSAQNKRQILDFYSSCVEACCVEGEEERLLKEKVRNSPPSAGIWQQHKSQRICRLLLK